MIVLVILLVVFEKENSLDNVNVYIHICLRANLRHIVSLVELIRILFSLNEFVCAEK